MLNPDKKLPANIVNIWPEVFSEVSLNVIPIEYLQSISFSLKNNNTLKFVITPEDRALSWMELNGKLVEISREYKNIIEGVDFKMDSKKIRRDIERSTKQFLRKLKI